MRHPRWIVWGLVAAWALPAAAAAADRLAVEREETWQVIYLSGQRVGYARVLVDPRERDGQTLVHTSAETHMKIKRFGQTLRMKTSLSTEETVDGDLLNFQFAMENPPASVTRTTGKVVGERLQLEAEINGVKTKSSKPWTPGVKSPSYQDRALRNAPLKAGETKSFDAFLPEMSQVAKIKVAAFVNEPLQLLNGSTASLQKMKVTNSLLPGVVTDAWVDEQGQTIKSVTNMLGTEMVTHTVSRDEALKALDVAEVDLGVSTLVKTRAIANPYDTKKVVYRITIRDDDPSQVLPASDRQAVRKLGDETAELTITAVPLPASAHVLPAADEFTKPTPYLQSDDAKVQEHARKAAGDKTDPAEIARAMEKYVQETLTSKNFSTALASAAEVADKLEGDCTEHAVLLAAMLRAKGVPSRVAVGLVYVSSSSAFGGHMWTEACLDGKWIPLDGTLGRGGVGATHIKLGDATFADEAAAPLSSFAALITVIGKLRIDVVSVE